MKQLRPLLSHGDKIFRGLLSLLFNGQFLIFTFFVNLFISGAGLAFYLLEKEEQGVLLSPLDGVYWSYATVTTVGYGDVVPATMEGKILSILLMVGGIALFATYTAIFSQFMISNQIVKIRQISDKRFDNLHSIEQIKEHLDSIERALHHQSQDDTNER